MNGNLHKEVERRVAFKMKEEVSHEHRHARQEVLTEVLIDKFDSLSCQEQNTKIERNARNISWLWGAGAAVLALIGSGVLAMVFGGR